MTDEELAEREHWLEQKLAQERARVFDMVAQAVGQMLAERKDDRGADYLSGEIAALWRALAQAQKQIAQIHQDRIKALLASEPVDAAKKLN